MKYVANDKKAAWAIADDLFPSDYVHDSSRSQRAGYDVYMSTFPGMDAWISDLGDRLEVNLPDGQTVNVWIEDNETAAARRANAARLVRIVAAAKKMYRAFVSRHPEDRSRDTWYEAMRQAAREVKGEEAVERLTLDEMELALDGEAPEELRQQVIEALRHGATMCPKWAQTRTRIDRETGEKVLAPSSCALWMGTRETWPESIDHIIAEAWATYLERSIKRAKEQGKGPGAVIFWSTYNACQKIDYEFNPHKRSKRTPEQRAALELRMIGGRPSDPEAAALAASLVDAAAPGAAAALAELAEDGRSYKSAALGLLGRYSPDAIAAALTAAGQTQGEIAALLGVPQCRISRALSRIRDRAAAIING